MNNLSINTDYKHSENLHTILESPVNSNPSILLYINIIDPFSNLIRIVSYSTNDH